MMNINMMTFCIWPYSNVQFSQIQQRMEKKSGGAATDKKVGEKRRAELMCCVLTR